MTIFFDTTELNNDPLFYNHSLEIFFELSKAEKIKIYISEVVLSYELKKHYIDDFKKKLKLYNEASKQFYKFWDNKYNKKIYNDNEIEANFTNRINKLMKDNYFTIVKFDHENIINSILDRYMKSKAPFHEIDKNSENKSDKGWKDYIIWESYKEIIKNGKSGEYIFISNNHKEFSSKKLDKYKGMYAMHNDYYQDIKNKVIKCYTDIYSFINQDKKYQDIYKKYLINKYNKDKSIIEELFLFTSKIIDKYSYESDNSYSIKKINIPDNTNIKGDGMENNINIKIIVEYDNKKSEKTGYSNISKKEENEDNKKLKNYDKEEETIPTKCSFTLNLQKLEFNIISIEKFVKEKEIKKDNYNTNY